MIFTINDQIFLKIVSFRQKFSFSERFQLKNKHFSKKFLPAALVFALTQRFHQNFCRKSKIYRRFQIKMGVFNKKFSPVGVKKGKVR